MKLPELLVPETEPRPRAGADPWQLRYIRSYLVMRTVIGGLSFAVPPLLLLIDRFYFADQPWPKHSVSAYYHSGARDIFVGYLCVVGVFLVTYLVTEKNLDNFLTCIAGVAVITVALLPTGRDGNVALTLLQDKVGEHKVAVYHGISAAFFIGCLVAMCFLFGLREGRQPPRPTKRSPRFWRCFHWACCGFIVFWILYLGFQQVFGSGSGRAYALLVCEFGVSVGFGVSWLCKGLELDVLLHSRPAVPVTSGGPPVPVN